MALDRRRINVRQSRRGSHATCVMARVTKRWLTLSTVLAEENKLQKICRLALRLRAPWTPSLRPASTSDDGELR